MLIVISGRPGSGKSSLAKYIAEKYKLRRVSAGEMFRKIAVEHGFEPKGRGFLRFHKELERDTKLSKKIDREVDRKVAAEAKRGNCVIEGWLAGYFVKNADLKIFLNVDIGVAARRISVREGHRDHGITVERERSFLRRAKSEYGIDPNDVSYYDFIINTKKLSQEDTQRIVDSIIKVVR